MKVVGRSGLTVIGHRLWILHQTKGTEWGTHNFSHWVLTFTVSL